MVMALFISQRLHSLEAGMDARSDTLIIHYPSLKNMVKFHASNGSKKMFDTQERKCPISIEKRKSK